MCMEVWSENLEWEAQIKKYEVSSQSVIGGELGFCRREGGEGESLGSARLAIWHAWRGSHSAGKRLLALDKYGHQKNLNKLFIMPIRNIFFIKSFLYKAFQGQQFFMLPEDEQIDQNQSRTSLHFL
jgi:hypothetical protein